MYPRALPVLLLLAACDSGSSVPDEDPDTDPVDPTSCGAAWEATGYTEASHTKDGDLDYDVIFDDSTVEQGGDRGMGQIGQDLALPAKTLDRSRAG